MSTDSCIPPNIQEIAAPLLLGAVWNWTLYGILVVQVYVYSYNFTKDRRAMKILVYVVFFLETLQTALSGADLYYWFVSGFGDIKHLSNPYTSPYNTPIIGAVIFMVVQFFFSYRIWVLSGWKRTWPLCAVICLLSVVGAGGAFTGAVRTIIYGKFPMGRMLMVEAMTWYTGNALCDLLIAISMVHLLTRRAVLKDLPSNHALVKIIRMVVETNVLTTFVGITAFVIVAASPDKNWFICPTAVLGKLYSNTLLVSFNNRISIRDADASSSWAVASASRGFGFSPANLRAESIVLSDMGTTTRDDREVKAKPSHGAEEMNREPQFINIA